MTKKKFYPWFCWFIVGLFYLFQYGLLIFPAVISPQLQSSLHLSPADVGIFSSAFLYTYIAMQIVVGILYDRFPARSLLSIACLIIIAGCVLLSLTNSFFLSILGRMLMGLGGSFAFVGALYVGRMWFSATMFPVIAGLTSAMSGIGLILFSGIFDYLTKLQSWRIIVLELSIIFIILLFFTFAYVKEKNKVTTMHQNNTVLGDIKTVMQNKTIWLLCFYIMFQFSFFAAMTSLWEITYLRYRDGFALNIAIIDNSLIIAGYIFGALIMGYLSQKYSNLKIMLISSGLLFVSLFGRQLIHPLVIGHTIINIISLFIIGLASSSCVICFNIVKKIIPPKSQGLATGFVNMFFGLAGIIMMPLIGVVLNLTNNNYQLALIPVILCSLFAVFVAIALIIKEKRALNFQT